MNFSFLVIFLGILVRSFQTGRDLPQLFLFVRRQIRLNVLRIAPHQVNALCNHKVQVHDAGAEPGNSRSLGNGNQRCAQSHADRAGARMARCGSLGQKLEKYFRLAAIK